LLNPPFNICQPFRQMLNRHPSRLDSSVRFAPLQNLIARGLVSTRKFAHVWAKRLTTNVLHFGNYAAQLFNQQRNLL
jgi:hypothetical protein